MNIDNITSSEIDYNKHIKEVQVSIYEKQIKELQQRIDKAIEYIKADYINGAVDGLSWLEVQKLLKILKGEE